MLTKNLLQDIKVRRMSDESLIRFARERISRDYRRFLAYPYSLSESTNRNSHVERINGEWVIVDN